MTESAEMSRRTWSEAVDVDKRTNAYHSRANVGAGDENGIVVMMTMTNDGEVDHMDLIETMTATMMSEAVTTHCYT